MLDPPLMILQNSNIKVEDEEEDFPNDNFASLAEQFEFAPNNILETRLNKNFQKL